MKEDATYQGLLHLDRIPQSIKKINWGICFVLAIFSTFLSNSDIGSGLWNKISEVRFVAMISPICFILGWLRITGIRWQYILLFVVLLPIVRFLLIAILFSIFGV